MLTQSSLFTSCMHTACPIIPYNHPAGMEHILNYADVRAVIQEKEEHSASHWDPMKSHPTTQKRLKRKVAKYFLVAQS